MNIFLSSILRDFIPGYDPGKGVIAEISSGTPVYELCDKINIPSDMVTIVMVDGKIVEKEYILNGTERVYLFPAIGGG